MKKIKTLIKKMTKMQFAFLLLVLSIFVYFFGCTTTATRSAMRRDNMQDYNPGQYPLSVEGPIYREFESNGVKYGYYYFEHYPWPFDMANPSMKIIIDIDSLEEPIFSPGHPRASIEDKYITLHEGYKTDDIKRKYVENGWAFWMRDRLDEPYPLEIPPYDTTEIQDLPAKLVVTLKNQPLPEGVLDEQIDYYVHIEATRDGPGSTTRTGRKQPDGQIQWDEPRVLINRPTLHTWNSPWNNLIYMITIPIDIVTLPIQLPFIMYSLYQGYMWRKAFGL